jgi:hypothetical protein
MRHVRQYLSPATRLTDIRLRCVADRPLVGVSAGQSPVTQVTNLQREGLIKGGDGGGG